jgi:hypothetical protein
MLNNFMNNRPVSTIWRDNTAGNQSAPRQMGGLWQPRNQAFLTNDLTIFDAQENCAFALFPANVFAGDVLRDGFGSRLGVVVSHNSPGIPVFGPTGYDPVVWATPDTGNADLFGFAYSTAVPAGSLVAGLQVTVLTSPPLHGIVMGMSVIEYPFRCGPGQAQAVNVAAVRVDTTVVTPIMLGAPVIGTANPNDLVGLVIDMTSDEAGTTFYCYPALDF